MCVTEPLMAGVDNNRAFSGPGPEPGRLQFQHVAMLGRHRQRRSFETLNTSVDQVTRTFLSLKLEVAG